VLAYRAAARDDRLAGRRRVVVAGEALEPEEPGR